MSPLDADPWGQRRVVPGWLLCLAWFAAGVGVGMWLDVLMRGGR